MSSDTDDRSSLFPAIERKHGRPIASWLELLASTGEARYPEQMALLQQHGFSRTHANAVVQWHRGSRSARRFAGPDAYFDGLEPAHAITARAIFAAIDRCHHDLELVMAWNQPMLRTGGGYVFGLSSSARHLTLNPWSTQVLDAFRPRLTGLRVNKHTFVVPVGWDVDADLLCDLVAARLAELA